MTSKRLKWRGRRPPASATDDGELTPSSSVAKSASGIAGLLRLISKPFAIEHSVSEDDVAVTVVYCPHVGCGRLELAPLGTTYGTKNKCKACSDPPLRWPQLWTRRRCFRQGDSGA